jgi:hypothetical protein
MTMPFRAKLTFVVFSAFLLGASRASFGQCTQVLSVGDNVASAVSSAVNGSTLCLNSGNYGTVSLSDIGRTGFVTIRSASGTGARMSPQIGKSEFIKFDSMTLTNVVVNSCSVNIEFWNSTFVPNAPGLVFNYDTCVGVTNMALIVDGVTFDRVQNNTYEGRLSVKGAIGLKIRQSVFSGVPTANQSDGIFIGGASTNVEIGPGNHFTGILEALCGGVHCDAIQDYGGGPNNIIKQNLFEHCDTFIMMPDGSKRLLVENNVFNGVGVSYRDKIQLGSAVDPVFRHNTLRNVRASFDSKIGLPATSNAFAENNILTFGSSWKTSNGSGCTGCTFSSNLFDNSQYATGPNYLIGTPTFVRDPALSLADWQLSGDSIGKNAGNDGLDMGVNVFGVKSKPTPPTNLRVIVK